MASVDEIWLVDFGEPFPGEPANRRPAVVVGPPDHFGPDMPFVMVCPCTTTHRGLSLHVELEPSPTTGLDTTSYVQCELIRSIGRRRLVARLGAVDPAASHHIHQIIKTLLDH